MEDQKAWQNHVIKTVNNRARNWNEVTKISQDKKRQFWSREDIRYQLTCMIFLGIIDLRIK